MPSKLRLGVEKENINSEVGEQYRRVSKKSSTHVSYQYKRVLKKSDIGADEQKGYQYRCVLKKVIDTDERRNTNIDEY